MPNVMLLLLVGKKLLTSYSQTTGKKWYCESTLYVCVVIVYIIMDLYPGRYHNLSVYLKHQLFIMIKN